VGIAPGTSTTIRQILQEMSIGLLKKNKKETTINLLEKYHYSP